MPFVVEERGKENVVPEARLYQRRLRDGERACVLHRFNDNHNNKWPQALFFKITSSLLKLVSCSTHGGETWCAPYFLTPQLANVSARGDETWSECV